MIEELSITNLGVIEKARVTFGPGLNSITGETGAGKTMALTSLLLLMGSKTDSSKVRSGAQNAVVEGTFVVPMNSPAVDIVRNAGGDVDLDGEHAVIYISRHVPVNGRSRAYVGGHVVPLGVLKDLSEYLVTVHGQADQLRLKTLGAQRHALDEFGADEIKHATTAYRQQWDTYIELTNRYREFQEKVSQASTERLALEAFIKRVDAVEPYVGEEDELKSKALLLENFEDVRMGMVNAVGALDHDATGALQQLDTAASELKKISAHDSRLVEMAGILTELSSRASDVSNELSYRLSMFEADPQELDEIYQRRSELRALQRELGMGIAEIVERRQSADERLEQVTNPQAMLDSLAHDVEVAREAVWELGKTLYQLRVKYGEKLSKAISTELSELAMKDATFSVEVNLVDEPHSMGVDTVEFKFSPHRTGALMPLGSTASGGEMSRVMLALEVVIAQGLTRRDHTFIFDEVDAGIGGKTALSIGQRLARLGKNFQVIAVTHLAQVAAYADCHITVHKLLHDSGGTTDVRALDHHERTVELARMLSGHAESEAALAHAAELLTSAHVS